MDDGFLCGLRKENFFFIVPNLKLKFKKISDVPIFTPEIEVLLGK